MAGLTLIGMLAFLVLMPTVFTLAGKWRGSSYHPFKRMNVVDDPECIMPVHERIQRVINRAEGRSVTIEGLERFDFYAAAQRAFAVIRTSDPGPYGCFILRKGVIDLAPDPSTQAGGA